MKKLYTYENELQTSIRPPGSHQEGDFFLSKIDMLKRIVRKWITGAVGGIRYVLFSALEIAPGRSIP